MMTLEQTLSRINGGSVPRSPGQWTPDACAIWREGPAEVTDLIYAALVLEQKQQRLARPQDETAIRELSAKIKASTARARGEAA